SGEQTVTATSGANMTSTAAFAVTPDTTAPDGGSATYPDGYVTTESVPLTLDTGSDSGSGLATGTELQRASATLTDGTCDTFGGFATIAGDPLSSTSDLTVTGGHCYQYRFVVTDNVGNQTTYDSPNVVKVDAAAPTASQDDPGQYLSGTVSLTATASD